MKAKSQVAPDGDWIAGSEEQVRNLSADRVAVDGIFAGKPQFLQQVKDAKIFCRAPGSGPVAG